MSELKVLIDNEIYKSDLINQHGLSIYVESKKSKILIDTGQNGNFLKNALSLSTDISSVTHLLISHGHYDHAGGAANLLETGAKPKIIIHPEAFLERKSIKADMSSHSIGIPWSIDLLKENNIEIIWNKDTYEIETGVLAVNVYDKSLGAPPHNELQCYKNEKWEDDNFCDEQVLLISTECGIVVLTGCSHNGISNIITVVNRITNNSPLYAIIGGIHLGKASPEEINLAAESMKDVKNIWINHCTGMDAYKKIKEILGEKVCWAGTGFTCSLPPIIAFSH